MNPVSARLLSQQLVSPQFKEAVEVVSWFGAMQAQDPRSIQRAVTMRTQKPSPEAFREAFDSGRIIRSHLLRCTWQLVTAEDYPWMRSLCYDKGRAVLDGWTKSMGFSYSGAEKERILSIIEDTVSREGETTEDVIRDALLEGGVPKERLVYNHQLRLAELEGIVCSGTLGPKNTYRLVRERIPGPQKRFGREEALAFLARKYFRSHGPATLEDFIWWSGLSSGDCRKGIGALGEELIHTTFKGRSWIIHRDSRTRGFRKGCLLLLPAYDEYLIGYKSRDLVLDPANAHYAHDKKGIFRHVVAYDGEIVGNWKPSEKDGGITFFKELQ